MKRFKIDFYEDFPLATPVVGLIEKIDGPKGTKKKEDNGYMTYKFQAKDFWIYKEKPLALESGLYHVLDVCSVNTECCWNNYLFIIDTDGTVYPVGEYLDCPDTHWVKKAFPLVKSYFAEEELDAIELTDFRPKKRRSGWSKK